MSENLGQNFIRLHRLNALPGAVKLAEKYDVEMPIVNALNDIVNNGKSAKEVVFDLMNREAKVESLFCE